MAQILQPYMTTEKTITLITWTFVSKQCLCILICCIGWAFLFVQMVKSLPAVRVTQVQSLGQEDPLEKEMSIHSSILA